MSASLAVAFALLQAAAPTAASAAPPPATPAAQPVKPVAEADPDTTDPVVCRRDPDPGARFAPKQCHRMSTWNRMARESN